MQQKPSPSFSVTGNLVDITAKTTYPASVLVKDGTIASINKLEADAVVSGYILPGFIDSHVHIESSMLVPGEFARMAVVHGTVATISDPHEIGNVCGVEGVEYMIENGKNTPFKFYFGAPSCVPATTFETAGASIDSAGVVALLARDEIKYLSEMMNFPGVLNGDSEVMKKIQAAHVVGKPVDGHAPGLRGELAKQYIGAGISTDHECFTAEEALDKLQFGMKILIREGSAAKNFDALIPLMHEHYANMMFCSDDKHPDSLEAGHINQLCERAVAKGIDVYKVLQAACINPAKHYKLEVGLLQEGDPADFIIADDLIAFKINATYINGILVAENGKTLIASNAVADINKFDCAPIHVQDIRLVKTDQLKVPVIEALDGQLITNKLMVDASNLVNDEGELVSNANIDVLKLVVVNRYYKAKPAISFIKNFGFKTGAIASSVAHDSHNIVAVGVDDNSIAEAINLVIAERGGVSCVDGENSLVLGLPIAGLMSAKDGYTVAKEYTAIDAMAKSLGSQLSAPFMTLSFMALLVIPHLKLSDKGLFDGDTFSFLN